ncbi:MAG: TIGR00296 family protein [Candidatus Bathyarchaeia archaeon]
MPFELTPDEGVFLVKLARRAIATFLRTGGRIAIPEDTPEGLQRKAGVFVTLNSLKGEARLLRGCIGYPLPALPLAEATIRSAIESATGDPRFPPVTQGELSNIAVEVSVLTPPTLIEVDDCRDYPRKIEVGKDGLIVERGLFRGLLLPQVPVEWGWDGEEFLANCCMKAGLPPDMWLVRETRISKFQAIIFEEVSPDGEVRSRDLERK